MKNIIYGLYCPISKVPVYIGKTTKGLDRLFCHIDVKSHNSKVNEWVNELKKMALSPVIVVLEECSNEMYLNDKEKFWVNKFICDGFLLLNQDLIKPYVFTTFLSSEEDDSGMIEIANFIKIKRKMLKLTQQELGKKAGVGLRMIRELEQGSKTNFSTDCINRLLKLFGAKLSISKI